MRTYVRMYTGSCVGSLVCRVAAWVSWYDFVGGEGGYGVG